MKALHWIIFALAAWIFVGPIIGHDAFQLVFNRVLEPTQLIDFLIWQGFLLGLIIAALAMVIVMLEQASKKTPGLKAMHWLQVVFGLWIAIAPFLFATLYETLFQIHTISALSIAVFAILQIINERYRTN